MLVFSPDGSYVCTFISTRTGYDLAVSPLTNKVGYELSATKHLNTYVKNGGAAKDNKLIA